MLKNKLAFLAVAVFILSGISLSGCSGAGSSREIERYPRKPDSSDERKAGPAMLLYEAAEAAADPNNVIVIPPDESEKSAP